MAVMGHASVASVVAVPYPDPIFEERLCAVLVLRDGYRAPSISELGDYLKTYGLAKYKWPERIEVVSEFPLTTSGKLNRSALKDQIAQGVQGVVVLVFGLLAALAAGFLGVVVQAGLGDEVRAQVAADAQADHVLPRGGRIERHAGDGPAQGTAVLLQQSAKAFGHRASRRLDLSVPGSSGA